MKAVMRPVSQMFRAFIASALSVAGLAIASPVALPVTTAGAAEATAGIPVMGPNVLSAAQLANWYRATKRTPAIPVTIDQFTQYYIDEGRAEGLRGDLAFAQSIVETGYLGFVGSIVKPENYNYAGMGACDSCNSGRQFPSAQVGVRAQIQHLKNYADPTSRAATLAHPPVVEWYGRRSNGVLDPALAIYNFDTFFAKGRAPTWNQMGNGNWATAPSYSTAILQVYNRMLVFNGMPGSCPPDRLAVAGAQASECPVPIRTAGRAVSGGTGGYYVLNGNGAVNAIGAPFYGNPSFSWDIARDIQTTPDGHGYVILDGYGGVHLYGTAATGPLSHLTATPYFGFDIARSLALTADGAGYFVLDGFGGVHSVGTAHKPTGKYPYWQGWDIARSVAVTLDGKGLAVLDGFGAVWQVGTVQKLGTTYFGFDIARDIVVTPSGDGYALLDGFGAVHRFGATPAATNIGYATYDRWRSLTIRNGRYTVVRNDGYSVT